MLRTPPRQLPWVAQGPELVQPKVIDLVHMHDTLMAEACKRMHCIDKTYCLGLFEASKYARIRAWPWVAFLRLLYIFLSHASGPVDMKECPQEYIICRLFLDDKAIS